MTEAPAGDGVITASTDHGKAELTIDWETKKKTTNESTTYELSEPSCACFWKPSKLKTVATEYGGAVLALSDLASDCLTTFKDFASDPIASSDLFAASVACIVISSVVGLAGTVYYVFAARGDDGEPLMDRKSKRPGSFRDGLYKNAMNPSIT